MQNQNRHPHDDSDLSALKEFPIAFKSGCHEVSISVDRFSDHFWEKGAEVLQPVAVAFVLGLVLATVATLAAVAIFKKK